MASRSRASGHDGPDPLLAARRAAWDRLWLVLLRPLCESDRAPGAAGPRGGAS